MFEILDYLLLTTIEETNPTFEYQYFNVLDLTSDQINNNQGGN